MSSNSVRRQNSLVFGAILLFLLGSTGHTAETNWREGKLGYLLPYVGPRMYEQILEDPYVKSTLRRYLGRHYRRFGQIANESYFSGIAAVDGIIHLSFTPPVGDIEEVDVWINLEDGEIIASLAADGFYWIFARERDFSKLPRSMRLDRLHKEPPGFPEHPENIVVKGPYF